MLKVNKTIEPYSLKVLRKKCKNWDEVHIKCKEEYIQLKDSLTDIENNLNGITYCVYCEIPISRDDSCIEHIKPRRFTSLVFDYHNLIVSCKSHITCTSSKGSMWDDSFIHPVSEIPSDYIIYSADGMIDVSNPRVHLTVGLLNLNSPRLVEFRKKIWLTAFLYVPNNIQFISCIEDQPSLIEFIIKSVK